MPSIQADGADAAAIEASVERTVAELGGLDVLVNNAGILRLSTVKDISLEDINAPLEVNVRAPIFASKTAIPHLARAVASSTSEASLQTRLQGAQAFPSMR
jgi:NAD(P)-dependent dehydrogenase (short-subunit alcohol dehydrogenase family)